MAVSGKNQVVVDGQPGPTTLEVLSRDKHKVPEYLLDDRNDYFGSDVEVEMIDKERYLSRRFYERERELFWGRTWQMACREEQIPNVGDYQLYEVAGKSLIIVRSAKDEIKAYYNSCLHRGRTLCDAERGHVANFRCKFHGMMWRLDGRCGHIPSRWDFPHVKETDFSLPEVKVARWQGFVYINMDPECISFDDYIQNLNDLVGHYDFENRFIAVHVGVIIHTNWKIAYEAFMEDYHGMATHPQVLPFANMTACMLNVRKDRPHWSRSVTAFGVRSPLVADTCSEQKTFDEMKSQLAPPGEVWEFNPDETARSQVAEIYRRRAEASGLDAAETPESILLDSWQYYILPNSILFGGQIGQIIRFRPWEDDHEQTLMEVIFLPIVPKGAPRPPSASFHLLPVGSCFSDAPELGPAGSFLDQDLSNMQSVLKGLRSFTGAGAVTAKYQETQIRHFNAVLDMYMNSERPKGG